VTGYAPKEF